MPSFTPSPRASRGGPDKTPPRASLVSTSASRGLGAAGKRSDERESSKKFGEAAVATTTTESDEITAMGGKDGGGGAGGGSHTSPLRHNRSPFADDHGKTAGWRCVKRSCQRPVKSPSSFNPPPPRPRPFNQLRRPRYGSSRRYGSLRRS